MNKFKINFSLKQGYLRAAEMKSKIKLKKPKLKRVFYKILPQMRKIKSQIQFCIKRLRNK